LQQGRLIKSASLRQLWMPTTFADGRPAPWALGWPAIRRGEHRAVAGIGGGRSAFYVYPDDDLADHHPDQSCRLAAGAVDRRRGRLLRAGSSSKSTAAAYALYRLRQLVEQSGYGEMEAIKNCNA
jgi:hypothetical protein